MLENNHLIGFGAAEEDGFYFWRVLTTFSSGFPNFSNNISEAEMRAASGGVDITYGGAAGTAFCKTVNGTHPPAHLFDDNTSTYCIIDVLDDIYGWFGFQFTNKSVVKELVLQSPFNAGPVSITLQKSNDGSTYADVQTFTPSAWTANVAKTFTVT